MGSIILQGLRTAAIVAVALIALSVAEKAGKAAYKYVQEH